MGAAGSPKCDLRASQLGEHGKVLQVLVREMGDVERAEEYCEWQVAQGGAGSNPYVCLLELLVVAGGERCDAYTPGHSTPPTHPPPPITPAIWTPLFVS